MRKFLPLNRLLLLIAAWWWWWSALAGSPSTDPLAYEHTAGIYTAYPEKTHTYTPAPEGYAPFYISHYGRHGSRWITDDVRYTRITDLFDSLAAKGQLTPLGTDVRERLHRVTDDAVGRSGHLTPKGERQHRGIAQRMLHNYPEVFADSSEISAVASTSIRCIMSMGAFTEALKELNPALQITRSAYDKDMAYIAYTSPEGKIFSADDAPWRTQYWAFVDSTVHPDRLIASLCTEPETLAKAQKLNLMTDLYWIASDMQNVDIDENFYDIFTYPELYSIWRCINARMYVCNGPSPASQGVMKHCADNLLRQIVTDADAAIAGGKSANLRFGHDSHLLRLLTLMETDGSATAVDDMADICTAWIDYELSPMAANLQLIFYGNAEGNVMVKILLNEEETRLSLEPDNGPYYSWSRLRDHFFSLLTK